jgi:dTDP-4-dehydrorhamnose 3,5-epimerase
MRFVQTKLKEVYEVHMEPTTDHRGFFARSWCRREFENHGLNPKLVQCNVSFNPHQGTLRGMHYQDAPHKEAKVVRCTRGSVFDVAIDLRPDSATYKQWVGVELSAEKRNMLYVPEGFAHGFLTLEDDTEVFYQMSEFYEPDCGRGVRWDDQAFSIEWPSLVRVISERDRAYPDLR